MACLILQVLIGLWQYPLDQVTHVIELSFAEGRGLTHSSGIRCDLNHSLRTANATCTVPRTRCEEQEEPGAACSSSDTSTFSLLLFLRFGFFVSLLSINSRVLMLCGAQHLYSFPTKPLNFVQRLQSRGYQVSSLDLRKEGWWDASWERDWIDPDEKPVCTPRTCCLVHGFDFKGDNRNCGLHLRYRTQVRRTKIAANLRQIRFHAPN